LVSTGKAVKDVSQQLKHHPEGLLGFSVLALPMTRLAIIQTSFQRSTRSLRRGGEQIILQRTG